MTFLKRSLFLIYLSKEYWFIPEWICMIMIAGLSTRYEIWQELVEVSEFSGSCWNLTYHGRTNQDLRTSLGVEAEEVTFRQVQLVQFTFLLSFVHNYWLIDSYLRGMISAGMIRHVSRVSRCEMRSNFWVRLSTRMVTDP